MTTVVAKTRVSWRQREDGIPEIVPHALLQVIAAELVTLLALCGAAALLGAQLAGWDGLLLPAAVLAAYGAAHLLRRPGRALPLWTTMPAAGTEPPGRRTTVHRPGALGTP